MRKDRAGLDKELERVFDICQGCRLCFNLCPSFPALFDATDRNDGDVRGLTAAEKERVIDLCYGCKLCEIKCPYTPHDGHEFQLDFPRLILRAKLVKAKEEGVKLRERVLARPDQLGKAGALTPALANMMCRQKFQRVAMEKLLGIHRDKPLPDFAAETFDKWLPRNPLRTEKMAEREAIQHEIDTSNELLPAAGELTATLLIEYTEPRERDAALERLVGLERHLWLKIGADKIAARFDDRQMSDERISAVQFLRFSLEGVDAARLLEFAGKGEVAVEADHPSLAARGAIGGLLAASLAEDLR
jgi:NAD-dependent dihydropyrimidine dehydrogenase PreA subunit